MPRGEEGPRQLMEEAQRQDGTGPRVLLVDDHPVFRSGLADLLRELGVHVVGEAGDAGTAISLTAALSPDVVVMDLGLPDAPGADAIRTITAGSGRPQVVVLTITAGEEDILDALAAGASGYLLKDASTEEIAAAISAASNGESAVSPPIASKLVRHVRREAERGGDGHRPPPSLSPREREVLGLVARGWDNAQIGAALHLSAGTVKHHISSLLVKLEVDNRVQAAVRAVRERLIDA